MGQPIAANLIKCGHTVRGFDLQPQALTNLAASGGEIAESLDAVARDADLLWLMVVNGDQAERVLFGGAGDSGGTSGSSGTSGTGTSGGSGGAAAALPRGAIVVAACTQPPVQAARLAARLAEAGLTMLDAPVSGGVVGARDGTLTIMCSGPKAGLERAMPVLQATAKRIFHVGETAGLGSTAKMINQLLCGVHIAAAAEAMNVAESAGLSLATVHEIIGVSAGNSWMWGDRGPKMMQDNPPVTSALDIFVKDLGIVLDQGRLARQATPLAAAAHQMFLAASGQGHGGCDDSQVIRAYRTLNGTKKK
jgi:3-hydroxyisobutyrate dehydrogenase